jgi:methylmalonyl-CoA mutase N-terminal domain/subunit
MVDKEKLKEISGKRKTWEEGSLRSHLEKHPEWKEDFITTSSVPIKRLYTPEDIQNYDYLKHLNFPSQYPFTRGVQPTMYRGKLWTMRMFSGFGTAEESNKRYKYLLDHGETGLSVAFDFPTLYGFDSDHPMAKGEFGKCGVAVSSLKDMEILFNGIPLDKITTSMTINGPASILWAMYIVNAEKQGVSKDQIGGTIQNDILKEYIAQKSYIFPPGPSMRLIVDTFEYGYKHVPKWNTISISGYHIREAGSTAVQELAFTLADGLTYVEEAINRGLNVDDFAPRLSFFFNAHNDLFEEIAKYRAARRIWAREMKERFKAKNPRSLWLRFHTQTAGCALTAQQPENNIVRVAIQGLAAILGGTQSLHTNSMDEALALPSAKAARIALRTQQILAHESGVANTIDPLGGSYFIESLTNQMEEECYKYFDKIDAFGGVIPAIEKGFFQKEIANASYQYQKEIEKKRRTIVGVNNYMLDEPLRIELLKMDPEGEKRQLARLKDLRAKRDSKKVNELMTTLRSKAEGEENLMPYIIDCVRAYCTLGEITGIFKEVFGEYKEEPIY